MREEIGLNWWDDSIILVDENDIQDNGEIIDEENSIKVREDVLFPCESDYFFLFKEQPAEIVEEEHDKNGQYYFEEFCQWRIFVFSYN